MGKLKIRSNVLGMVGTNCYLVYEEGGSQAVLVDPADNADYLMNLCREQSLIPAAILLTHGHFDHIGAVAELVRAFRIPVYASGKERELLENPDQNLSSGYGSGISSRDFIPVQDGEKLELIGHIWTVLETPGHTAGSVCYYLEKDQVLFSGDTLFRESYGRTDFPTGSSRQLIASVTEKLFSLPDDVTVLPGHESQTSIGYEKQANPLASYC